MDFASSISTWINWLCVYPFIAVALIALAAFFVWSYRTDKELKAFPARLARAAPASAKVIEVGPSSTSRNFGDMSVAFRAEITPQAGAPYQVISVWEIEPAHVGDIQVGKSLDVRIDEANPHVIFPDAKLEWASQKYLKEFDENDMKN